jgi:hypothetical protein
MIERHRGFKITTRITDGGKWYEAEILNINGDLWGTLVHAARAVKTADLVAEAKALIDDHLARPTVTSRSSPKEYADA